MKIFTSAKVKEISGDDPKTVVVEIPEGERKFACRTVLAATGRKARLSGIDTRKLGIKTERGCIVVDEMMQTSVPGIYAAGDCIGGYQLAHAAYIEAEAAVENIAGGDIKPYGDIVMPRCVYSFTQFAAVGKTERELIAEKTVYRVGRFPYSYNGKAVAVDKADGLVKVLSDSSGRILGIGIAGAYASELITQGVIAMNGGIKVKDFERMIFPHPTMSEMLKDGILDTEGLALHLPMK